MTDKEFEDNVKDVLKNTEARLLWMCRKLAAGQVEEAEENYVLPKMALAEALRREAEQWEPPYMDKQEKEIKRKLRDVYIYYTYDPTKARA